MADQQDQQAQCHGCGTGCKAQAEATDLEMKEAHGEKKDEENLTLREQLCHPQSDSSSVWSICIISSDIQRFPISNLLVVLQASDEEEAEQKKQKKSKKTEGQVCDGEGEAATEHEGSVDDPEEKKGFLEKIKEKIPEHEEKAEGDSSPEPECPAEKKGILEQIKEKLPGCHRNGEEEKDKDS